MTSGEPMAWVIFGAIVVVNEGGEARGILTDRDIVVRGVADDRIPAETKVSEIFTTER